MRIALVAEDYYPQLGGVPEHVHNLALQLNSWGHVATVISSYMGPYPDAAFVRRGGASRMIYFNGGGSRGTTRRGVGRPLRALFRGGGWRRLPGAGGPRPACGVGAAVPARPARSPGVRAV